MGIIQLEDVLKDVADYVRRKYQGNMIEVDVEGTEPTDPPSTNVSVLTGYRYDASDADGHKGEYYFIPPPELKGKINLVDVGGMAYLYEREYRDSELWYGPASTGRITVTLKNGAVYRSSDAVNVQPEGNALQLKYAGITNGGRPTYYTYDGTNLKVGQKVSFKVGSVEKSFVAKTRSNSSIGYDWPDGTVVKNSDVKGRGIAVLIPANYAYPPEKGWVKL